MFWGDNLGEQDAFGIQRTRELVFAAARFPENTHTSSAANNAAPSANFSAGLISSGEINPSTSPATTSSGTVPNSSLYRLAPRHANRLAPA